MSDRIIEKTVHFDVPIERLWTAIATPDGVRQWFGDEARFTLEPGSEGVMVWDQHGSFALRVEEVDPPNRLVWSWVHEGGVAFSDAPHTTVEWNLSRREDGGSTLHLRETGFLTDLHFGQNTEGWEEELGELRGWLAG